MKATLKHLRSESGLWTPHGLRSLAKSSSLYMQRNTEHDAPYWRGPIWINLNYLTLAALDHYRKKPGARARAPPALICVALLGVASLGGTRTIAAAVAALNKFNQNSPSPSARHHLPGPYATMAGETYTELRQNVLSTVVGNYRRRGFLYEQYGDGDGEGKGSHPFTGWTALVVLIMGETYP